jgi:LmbE family N-acetylglucosaminyl deacetylase
LSAVFDHREVGTSEAVWRSSELDSAAELAVPGPAHRLLVLAAHPDDETLGAAGLIAAAAANGAHVRVVVATDGEGSHPRSPTHRPGQLAELRRAEVRAALAALDPSIIPVFLGLPDGHISDHVGTLTRYLATHLEGCTHLVTPWIEDAHPDHEACATAAARVVKDAPAIQHWQFPIWVWHWGTPADLPWSRLRRLDLSRDDLARKQAALDCHRTQHSPLSAAPGDEAVLPEYVLEHFHRPFEMFVVAPSTVAPASEAHYFDELYAAADDPWELEGSFYEQRKRALLLAALPHERFGAAFEPGCATGVLTAALAERCDRVVAWDVAEAALRQARQRLADRPHVTFERRQIPDEWPDQRFDLIVLSEVGYYTEDLARLVARVRSSLSPDGVLVGCHWRHAAPDHAQTAETVHAALGAGMHRLVAHVEEDFLLDVWSRSPGSVARDAGLIK